MAAGGLHISISAEKIFSLGGVPFTNSMLTSVVVSALLIAFALLVRSSLKETNRPTGIQNVAEWIVESLDQLVQSITGNRKKTAQFFPIVATFFIFILCNNWFGLIPGSGTIGFYEGEAAEHAQLQPSNVTAQTAAFQVQAKEAVVEPAKNDAAPNNEAIDAPVEKAGAAVDEHAVETKQGEKIFVPYFRAGTADLNMTLALGIVSVFFTQVFGVLYLKLGYFKKYINFSNPINFFVGLLEIISEFSKIISFAFRLFGNVFAGEVLLAVVSSLLAVVAPMPFYGLEIFVGFIQSLVFTMLSIVLFNMATLGHGDEH